MSIYENAIESIQVGVEDYNTATPKRGRSAVRNIVAGVLLLYKEKLCRLSPDDQPELLIKQNINPIFKDGEIKFVGSGNTVNIPTIKKRFKALGVHIETGRLDKLVSLRNDFEHYFTNKSVDIVRELIASSFLLIRDFITSELQEDPIDVLGVETWCTLLEVNEIFTKEREACEASIITVDWKYSTIEDNIGNLRCGECDSSLVSVDESYEPYAYPDIHLVCKQCSHEFQFCDVIEDLVDEAFKYELYNAYKDGDSSPLDTCPSCGLETFVYEEKCCVNCDYTLQYTECGACGTPLRIDEQENDGLCHSDKYRYDKVMAE